MLKKLGLVTVGATAGLLVAAPLASAAPGLPELPLGEPNGGTCTFEPGSASAVTDISGDSPTNRVSQAPLAGVNDGNEANCRDIANGQFNGMDVTYIPLGSVGSDDIGGLG